MKKYFLSVVLMLFVVCIFLCHSCNKDRNDFINSNNKGGLTLKDSEMSPEDSLFSRKLLRFQDQIDTIGENSQYQSQWNLSSDSAVWYMRSYLNAAYCKSTYYYTEVISDSIIVNIGDNFENEMNLNDIYLVYNSILNAVRETKHNLEYENSELNFVFFSDVFLENDSVYVPVLVVFGINPGSGGSPSQWQPFTGDIDWWFGETYGHCDHSGIGTDGAEEIEDILNIRVPPHYYFPPAPEGQHYVNKPDAANPYIRYGYEYLNPDDDTSGDNEEDYLIYYCSKSNGNITFDNKCLDVTELNFYYYGEWEVICDIIPEELNKPDYWILQFCEIWGENLGPNDVTRHKNFLYYAEHKAVENSVRQIEIDQ